MDERGREEGTGGEKGERGGRLDSSEGEGGKSLMSRADLTFTNWNFCPTVHTQSYRIPA